MRALIQRVISAKVTISGETAGEIECGLLVLICAMNGDTEAEAEYLTRKISALRIFADESGKMNRSLHDIGGSALLVSQFTLAADTRSGNRPGFFNAATPTEGKRLYDCFCGKMRETGIPIATGEFGADMKVSLVNDGPVTIWMDTEDRQKKEV